MCLTDRKQVLRCREQRSRSRGGRGRTGWGLRIKRHRILGTDQLVTRMWVFVFWVFFGLLSFLGLNPQHMEVPRRGVLLELQLPASTTATATRDPSRACDLHHSARQCRILNPLSEASWSLVGFVSAARWWELHRECFLAQEIPL